MKYILTIVFLSLSFSAFAQSNKLSGTLWEKYGQQFGLEPTLIYSVALYESKKNGKEHMLQPWPFAIRTPGKSYYPDTLSKAKKILKDVLEQYQPWQIDVGIMQINLKWNGHKVNSYEELLNKEINIKVGTQILKEAISLSPRDLAMGIGYYNTRNKKDTALRYGRNVIDIWTKLLIYVYNNENL